MIRFEKVILVEAKRQMSVAVNKYTMSTICRSPLKCCMHRVVQHNTVQRMTFSFKNSKSRLFSSVRMPTNFTRCSGVSSSGFDRSLSSTEREMNRRWNLKRRLPVCVFVLHTVNHTGMGYLLLTILSLPSSLSLSLSLSLFLSLSWPSAKPHNP